jgi:ABC-type sulfate/molybdate transport systems ATPase subunit
MLKIRNIHFARHKSILSGIDCDLKPGQILGLVGPSGAGKSTLLKIIAGLLDADSGTVKLGKDQIVGPKNLLIPGHPEVQLVNQDFELDLFHTVRENIVLKANYLPKNECNELVDELLDIFELNHLTQQIAKTLSGGEQQRLALARALAMEPKVILLDEPFAHVDAHLKSRISNYLMALKKIRKTIFILVTHDGQEVLSLADQIAFFADGEIQRFDSPEAFYFAPSNSYEGLFFGDLNQIKVQRKEVIFRPTEFSLDLSGPGEEFDLKFIRKSFCGPYYQNFFKVGKKETIVLYHKESLEYVHKIKIDKRIS